MTGRLVNTGWPVNTGWLVNTGRLKARPVFGWFLLLALAGSGGLQAAPPARKGAATLEQEFRQSVQPFLADHCNSCHSGSAPAAQLNLAGYRTLEEVLRDHPRWHQVTERLKAGDMPPKPMARPKAERSQQVIAWVERLREQEARRNAGDPGLVLARRLSNAEYNYTIADLTGVDLRPAREFPVDPANPEGFDNSGESLAMSPALLNKYLQAAREVANHLVLQPKGISFAAHPMLVETDREKYSLQRIVNFYKSQPTDYAAYFLAAWRYQHRAKLGQAGATLAAIARQERVSAKYLAMVWPALAVRKETVGPLAKVQAMWAQLPVPAPAGEAREQQEAAVRKQCEAMRDYVLRVRSLVAKHYDSPMMKGLSSTSQPLMNWKLNEFANNRLQFDPAALLVEGEPLPKVPEAPRPGAFFIAGNYDIVARQALAKLIKARLADQEPLRVPAGQRAAYQAAFGRFAALFPDAFYISERGRFFPDDTQDKGRLLSAGFHNVMGYFRDDLPLRQLILDKEQTEQLEFLWREFDFVADHTIRTYTQYYFNQSGEILGNGRESGSERPADKPITAPEVIFGLRDQYLAKAAAEPANDPAVPKAIRAHFAFVNDSIRAIEKARAEAEPLHREALLQFAAKAYRRPLQASEREGLLGYYRQMREKNGLSHEEAMRDSIVGILMSPDFCYRIDLLERPGSGAKPGATTLTKQSMPKGTLPKSTLPGSNPQRGDLPAEAATHGKEQREALTGYDLASRLSYFLWATMPDAELLREAAAGRLQQPAVLAAQAKRMLQDSRAQRFATEFAGHWFDFRRFQEHNAVDRNRFPAFDNALREAMFAEPVHFIADVMRNNRPVTELLYGKHTFVNGVLAKHYGMPEPAKAKGGSGAAGVQKADWVRVEEADRYGRGGLLAMSVFLTQNSPGLRTSPVKRGYWVVKRVLGEAIPPPPASVPELPEDEAKAELPLRQMLAKHRENPSCAGCHARFDSLGLAFEGYGPVGEVRERDLAGRPVERQANFPDGTVGEGLAGVQAYIRAKREADFLDNFCRKLLAYSLGRSLILSDEITIRQMRARLQSGENRFAPLVEVIVTSPQFRTKRTIRPVLTQQGQPGRSPQEAL